ncbi:MAG: cysteine desulfurase [Chloroflexota bacterium]|nr:cysteine desulfurase [Chloroflexota bacterium]
MATNQYQSMNYSLDIEKIRRDFPILRREISDGKSLVYLDNAATSQTPVQVIADITRFYRDHNANIHRGVHTLSIEATELHENARRKIAHFFNAPTSDECIFTSGTTESINLVAHAWGRQHLKKGDRIVITEIEHHSNIVPWQILRDEVGIELKYIPMLSNGALDMDYASDLITTNTKLVAITAMSNALGNITEVSAVVDLAKKAGALILLDGAQSAPHLKTDIQQLDIDFFACSAHKMLGPTGIGLLWAKMEHLTTMKPFMSGGDMILTVSMENSTWADIPAKFEAGTPNIAGAIGFGAACDYLTNVGMENIRNHEMQITQYALDKLQRIERVRIFGPLDSEKRGGVISFDIEGVHPHDVGQVLDSEGVAIRTGHHCAQPIMSALNVPATARASFYLYNTEKEVEKLTEALNTVIEYFG